MTAKTTPTAEPLLLGPAAADEMLLDAALWRLYRKLARHWLHALRGSLNAMSLNIVLLQTRAGAKGDGETEERTWQGLRAQVRDLDAALTRLLDHSVLEEAVTGRTDVASVLSGTSALLDPLARRKQVTLDVRCPEPGPLSRIDAATLHGVLVILLASCIEGLPARGSIGVVVTKEPTERIRMAISTAMALESEWLEPTLVESVRRTLQRHGGDLLRSSSTEGERLTLLLEDTTLAS
jgi:signal transduction histidine kinase